MKNAEKHFIFSPRIIRSPLGDCWGEEIETVLSAYPESYLESISRDGYNGIWVNVNLKETVPSTLFPGAGTEKTDILKKLVEKTAEYGLKVYCYLLEPRALPADHHFWSAHPELIGQPHTYDIAESDSGSETCFALCTSTDAVKQFLDESVHTLFKTVPGLGGAFLITASEFHTNCYSHFPIAQKSFSDPNIQSWAGREFKCEKCAERSPSEVVSEIINIINSGIKKADTHADVIAWTWSWYMLEPDPQKDLISRLSDDVILMSDFERGGSKKVAGKVFPVDEYSFSSTGPSPRFRGHLKTAKGNNLKVMAKIQTSSTHEIASVPYIPVPYTLAKKFKRMRDMGVSGYLGCWIFGGNASPMTRVSGLMSRLPKMTPAEAVFEVAREEFGEKSAETVCSAWKKFSSAWKEYPFSIPFLYYGPINYATAYPLQLDMEKVPPTKGWCPLPRDKNGHLLLGENTESWLKPFDSTTVVEALERLLSLWEEGMALMEKALELDSKNKRLEKEWRLAEHIRLSVKSTINIIRFSTFQDELKKEITPKDKSLLLNKIKNLMLEEIENARRDKELIAADEELGYHSEAAARLFTPDDLDYKISLMQGELEKIYEQSEPLK